MDREIMIKKRKPFIKLSVKLSINSRSAGWLDEIILNSKKNIEKILLFNKLHVMSFTEGNHK